MFNSMLLEVASAIKSGDSFHSIPRKSNNAILDSSCFHFDDKSSKERVALEEKAKSQK